MDEQHFTQSVLRERIVEHLFVGEALRTLWGHRITDVEVLRPEFDAHGYDLVMVRGKVVRHVQLKTGSGAKPTSISVSRRLGDAASGCVLWIHVSKNLTPGPYYWFGGGPEEPLPSLTAYKAARRTTRNKSGERPVRIGHVLVPPKDFKKLATLEDVLTMLLGPLTA